MNQYQLPVGENDDARLSYQSKTLEQVTHKHLADAGINSNSIVADIGCGNGEVVCYLLDKVAKIYAIDCSQEQLDLTKSKVDKIVNKLAEVEYVLMDIRLNSNLLLEVADVAFVRFLLIHIERSNHNTVLSNIKQILKPGGIVVSEETVWDNIHCSHCPEIIAEYKKTLYDDYMSMDLDFNTGAFLDKLYAKCGFTVEYFQVINRAVTPEQLLTMYQSIMNVKRSKTNDPARLAMYDRWDVAILSIPLNGNVIVRTSGTGCITARKIRKMD